MKQQKEYIVVISYDTLKLDYKLLPTDIDCFVLDEAHFLRNYDTARSKAILDYSKNAKTRYALTGTPAVNHPSDVFGILKYLYPKTFTSFWGFAERYFSKDFDPFSYGGTTIGNILPHRELEFKELLESLSSQRKQKDIMKWLPKINKETIQLEMNTKQEKYYKEMLTQFVTEDIDASSILAQLIRLKQISAAPEVLKLNCESSKINFILDYIKENPKEPIIIFSTFTSILNILKNKIKDCTMLTGEQNASQKQQSVDCFQNGTCDIILANVQAGGTGWTLDRAETIIFLDRSYRPDENAQAEARFIPINQERVKGIKMIYDLVNKNTIDEKILNGIGDKENIIKIVNNYKGGI